MHNLIPKPASITITADTFTLSNAAAILVPGSNTELHRLGTELSRFIKQHLSLSLDVTDQGAAAGNIQLALCDQKIWVLKATNFPAVQMGFTLRLNTQPDYSTASKRWNNS